MFADAQIVNEWEGLVDPEDDFFDFNTQIHGITADMVAGQPGRPCYKRLDRLPWTA
ncbi:MULTISPECIES: hypothetical protein [unclassified Pseudomonas]|uniref:hypothetical protein n=1 Tax=unclassified Pseudomonas TaxID=196821 RepID=UPI0015A789C8|nr:MULTISPECIES: hypothetical protein [unclassified Pseudomonas]